MFNQTSKMNNEWEMQLEDELTILTSSTCMS